MAVEARHLNLFPSQLMGNREIISGFEGNVNVYSNTAIGYGLPPLLGTTTETLLPMYNSAISESLLAKTAMKADNDLTYAGLPVSRKRTRDSINPLISFPHGQIQNQNQNNNNNNYIYTCRSYYTFLGEDISLQIQQQQLEIDLLISQHTEKVRIQAEEQRKRHSMRIVAAVEEGIMKRLRTKEEEIEKIGKLNWALAERVKSLYLENEIWRDLAQTNEATANALRNNLEQVLSAQVKDEQQQQQHRGGVSDEAAAAALMDDAQSCCGSNYGGGVKEGEERRSLDQEACGGEEKVVMKDKMNNDDCTSSSSGNNNSRMCRHCGELESSVLLLPCRHLCLCTVCGSTIHTCPICNTTKNASVHVIMSSS